MLIVHVHVRVRPDDVASFLDASVVNPTASRQEPGVLRFDAIADEADPTHVALVEVSRAAAAAAVLLANGGEPLDYMEAVGRGVPIAHRPVPYVAVPTTAGTGSEVTANAVLTSTADAVKASLRSPLMLPAVALVDPRLTVPCPPA